MFGNGRCSLSMVGQVTLCDWVSEWVRWLVWLWHWLSPAWYLFANLRGIWRICWACSKLRNRLFTPDVRERRENNGWLNVASRNKFKYHFNLNIHFTITHMYVYVRTDNTYAYVLCIREKDQWIKFYFNMIVL